MAKMVTKWIDLLQKDYDIVYQRSLKHNKVSLYQLTVFVVFNEN